MPPELQVAETQDEMKTLCVPNRPIGWKANVSLVMNLTAHPCSDVDLSYATRESHPYSFPCWER